MRGQGTLLWCGILSSILYVAADAASALASPGYDSVAQAISELTAIGAPTRPLLVAPFVGYDALVIAFGVGAMRAVRGGALALCGALLLAVGGIGLVATSLFPMHSRGSTTSLTDTMHIVLTALTVLCIAGAVLCAAVAQGHRFAGASIAALIVMLGAGALAAAQGADLAGGCRPLRSAFSSASASAPGCCGSAASRWRCLVGNAGMVRRAMPHRLLYRDPSPDGSGRLARYPRVPLSAPAD